MTHPHAGPSMRPAACFSKWLAVVAVLILLPGAAAAQASPSLWKGVIVPCSRAFSTATAAYAEEHRDRLVLRVELWRPDPLGEGRVPERLARADDRNPEKLHGR